MNRFTIAPACDPELNDGSWEQPGKIYDADPTG
jgi:hypothetical protein